jgi:large subunit ribosomal protein L4
MQTNIYNLEGKMTSKLDLPQRAFGEKDNPQLIAQVVKVYLSNQRKARAKAKTRGEVRGSRIKIWRQKGTGRARHGDRYAPIFVGGGVAHGPSGEANFKKRVPKKMKTKALAVALSIKAQKKEVRVITGLEKIEGKTKEMAAFLKMLMKKEKMTKKAPKFLLILSEKMEKVLQASRNLPNLEIILAQNVNPYQVLNNDLLLLNKEAVKRLDERTNSSSPTFAAKTKRVKEATEGKEP